VINKVKVPGHKGPHPDEYHEAVFKRLIDATEGKKGKDYTEAFEKTLEVLQKEVSTKGSELNKLITKTN
ncbi:MAG: AHH domain-containing protein, partial [Flammeovirgaceae bacterium]